MFDVDLKKYRGLIAIALIAILCDFFLNGKINVSYNTDSVILKGGIINEQIMSGEVISLEWRNSFEKGKRVSGVNTFRYYSGEFQDGDMSGIYHLFLQKKYTGKILVITTDSENIVIGSDSIDMDQLYRVLQSYKK